MFKIFVAIIPIILLAIAAFFLVVSFDPELWEEAKDQSHKVCCPGNSGKQVCKQNDGSQVSQAEVPLPTL